METIVLDTLGRLWQYGDGMFAWCSECGFSVAILGRREGEARNQTSHVCCRSRGTDSQTWERLPGCRNWSYRMPALRLSEYRDAD
jgi:hypothetical protein